jgi:hypothetical protein
VKHKTINNTIANSIFYKASTTNVPFKRKEKGVFLFERVRG